jgi:hypothetical protein
MMDRNDSWKVVVYINNEYQWAFFFLFDSGFTLQVGWTVFLSIRYLINAILSFFLWLICYGEIVFESLEVTLEFSILGSVI